MNLRVGKFYCEIMEQLELPDLGKLEGELGRKLEVMQFDSDMIAATRKLEPMLVSFFARNMSTSNLVLKKEARFEPYPHLSMVAACILADWCTFYNVMCLRRWLLSSERKKFLFQKDFFEDLRVSDLENITINDLVKGSGAVKLPSAVDDGHGGTLDEFIYYVGPTKNFFSLDGGDKESKALWNLMKRDNDYKEDAVLWCIAWRGLDNSWNYTAKSTNDPNSKIKDIYKMSDFVYVPKDAAPTRVTLENGYEDHLKPLFNCLTYLNTGEPDLRTFKNEIRYRGQGGTKPVRKDQNLCQDDITLVGYGFKKQPNYIKTHYYQPAYYARRGLAKKWTWNRGSWKRRKAGAKTEK